MVTALISNASEPGLSLASSDDDGAWHDSAVVRSYAAGERISHRDMVDGIHLVMEGEVALLSRDADGAAARIVSEGEAIELDSFFAGAARWQFDWVCTRRARVSFLSRSGLESWATEHPLRFQYLERLGRHPALEKLRQDLRFFGMGQSHVHRVILAMACRQVCSASDLGTGGLHVGVVASGGIDVDLVGRDWTCRLTRYAHGGALAFGHSERLSFAPEANTQIWCISYDDWAQLPGAKLAQIHAYIKFVDPFGVPAPPRHARGQLEPPGGVECPTPDPPVDSGPELSAFVADPRTLERRHARRRPFVQQHDEMDCGAACLSMVAKFHGRRISVPMLRALVHVTRDGASLFSVKKAAEHIGFEAIGVKAAYTNLRQYLVPFIALTEYHFVVVYQVASDTITVGDPARGVLTIAADEFEREWSGTALLLEPTPRFAAYPESTPSYRKYAGIFAGLWGPTCEVVLAICLLFIFGLAPPLFVQSIFDQVLPQKKPDLLNAAVLAMLAITVTAHLTEWVRDYLVLYVSSRLDVKFASLFLRRVFELPLGFFAVRRVGAITARLAELARIRRFIVGSALSIVVSTMSALLYSAVLGIYHGGLLLIVGVALSLTMGFLSLMSPRLKDRLQAVFKGQSKSNGMAFEHFSGFETLKSVNGMIAARWRWYANFAHVLELRRQSAGIAAITSSASEFLYGTTNVLVLIASVWLYTRQELSLGQVVTSNILMANISSAVVGLVGQWEGIQQLGVSFSRVDDVVTSAPEPTGNIEQAVRGGIEFEAVTFRYGSELSPVVLDEVSLSIKPGETVAFVGESGSGKTTLAHMVSMLYVPTRGRVLLDGTDAAAFSLTALRAQVATITQDNALFSGSILDNITLGDPNPSFEKAMAAAKAADAHGFINRMPHNYSSELGEQGRGLSGGQRQRLNIARALYKEPAILIMDEATSSLDSLSERRIMAGVKKSSRQRTTIMIAHRLNTVMNADRIFVFDKGRLVESGTHAELVRTMGRYYSLFHRQLA